MRRLFLLLAVAALGLPAWARAASPDPAAVRRVLGLLGAVAVEYEEGVDDTGRVVRPLELEEARMFLAEARAHAGRLGVALPADVDARLAAIGDGLARQAPVDEVVGRVDALKAAISETSGIVEEVAPPAPASAARGKAIFQQHCVECHGATGAGDGPEGARLERKPANFTDVEFMRGETPLDFFHIVTVGKRRAQMPAWDDVLSPQERWDAVAYAWSFRQTPGTLAEGQGVWLAACAGCHGVTGDGRGPWAAGLLTPVSDLTAAAAMTAESDQQLFDLVSAGIPGTAMPGFAHTLDETARWRAVAWVRALAMGGVPGAAAAPVPSSGAGVPNAGAVFDEVERLLAAAVDAHARGDAAATSLATEAYMTFEPLEKAVATRDPAAVTRVEASVLALRAALERPGARDDVAARAAELRAALDAARTLLAGQSAAGWALFLQSAGIILREGFEMVLVIGALLAYVARAGTAAMRRAIHAGTALGFVASLATAVLIARVFELGAADREALEGAAMLLASAVLFWVSYWIISKAEAERWQRYIQGKVKHAIARGSGAGLAAAAFLAVYREGFETVLFYQALAADVPAGDVMLPAGFVAGSVALAVLYVLFRRVGVKIPLQQFFVVTGAFLYLMAFVFAGKGVHELQEAALVAFTPVAWMPQIDALGIFPSRETLAAQGVFLVLLAYAAWVTWRRRSRAMGAGDLAALHEELRALRGLAEALRAEVAGRRPGDGTAVDGRLERLLEQIRTLELRVPPAGRA
jgi:high-affinity iron transporter